MKDWVPVGAALITAAVVLASVVYSQAQHNQRVADLYALEQRLELKVDAMAERLARIEGYLAHDNGVTGSLIQSPAPVAMPKPVPEPPTEN